MSMLPPLLPDGPDTPPANDEGALVRTLAIVRATYEPGHVRAGEIAINAITLSRWKTGAAGDAQVLNLWRTRFPADRLNFKRGLFWVNDQIQEDNLTQLPSLDRLRGWLDGRHKVLVPPHSGHHAPPSGETGFFQHADSTGDFHRDRSLAKAPLPQISERTAQRYGVNKRAWERQAARAQF